MQTDTRVAQTVHANYQIRVREPGAPLFGPRSGCTLLSDRGFRVTFPDRSFLRGVRARFDLISEACHPLRVGLPSRIPRLGDGERRVRDLP